MICAYKIVLHCECEKALKIPTIALKIFVQKRYPSTFLEFFKYFTFF